MIKAGQTILASEFSISLTAGEALSANDAVYVSTADGKAYKCDADDLTKLGFIGFSQEAVALGAAVTVKTHGLMTGFVGLTVGATYYVSGTSGLITSTKPTNYKIVGVALSSTVIRVADFLTKRTRVYTANDTWTKFAAIRWIEVEAVGAGGGGSGAFGGSNGANGSNSSFGSHLTAGGGAGGNNGTSDEIGIGGSAINGDVNIDGQSGSHTFDGAGIGGASFFGKSGGDGGDNTSSNSSDNGSTGGGAGGYSFKRVYVGDLGATETITVGTGGSGGAGSAAGSAGKNGMVLVHEYY